MPRSAFKTKHSDNNRNNNNDDNNKIRCSRNAEIISLGIRYSKTFLKQPLSKRPKVGFQDRLLLNAGQKYCRMLQESILQYFRPSLSYLPFVFKTFVLNIFEWPLKTGFTVGYTEMTATSSE